jgi:hypothetical protein
MTPQKVWQKNGKDKAHSPHTFRLWRSLSKEHSMDPEALFPQKRALG